MEILDYIEQNGSPDEANKVFRVDNRATEYVIQPARSRSYDP